MTRFIVRRIALAGVVLLLVSVVIFVLTNILPGDAARATLGEDATNEQLQRRRAELGLDQPAPVRYGRWLASVVSGDFGRSFRSREPVSAMLAKRLPITLELALGGLAFAIAIGVPAGILAATRRGRATDAIATVIATAGLAVPNFWLALLLVLVFSLWLRWLPPSGYAPPTDLGRHLMLMLLPVVTLGAALAAGIFRQTRGAMLDVLSSDFVRTARAKGLPERLVIVRHAFRNALMPVITIVGLQIGRLAGGAIVIESVFSLPGIGRSLVDGIFTRDYPVVQAIVIVTAAIILTVNLVVDLLYGVVDPRVRTA